MPHCQVTADLRTYERDFDSDMAEADYIDSRSREIADEWRFELSATRRIEWLGMRIGEIYLESRAGGQSMSDYINEQACEAAELEMKNP